MQSFLFSLLWSSAVAQQRPACQSREQPAALAGALNKTPGAAQWLLNSCYIVATESYFLCSFVSLPSLPLFFLKKSTEQLDLQMNGQGSDNKRELELRSTGIITVINSSSRGTASDGSIAEEMPWARDGRGRLVSRGDRPPPRGSPRPTWAR